MAEDFQAIYRSLTDEQLAELTLDIDDLTDQAQQALRGEIQRRDAKTIAALAHELELESLRTHCDGLSTYELKVYATSGECTMQWQCDELNQQLKARGVDGVEAVRALPGSTENAPIDGPLTIVEKYRDLAEAQVAQSVLNSAGILSFLADENTIRMDWFWSNLLGGIKLQVRPSDAESARQILDAVTMEEAHNEGSDGL